jgi:vesicle-fusing ATPase
VVRDNAKMRTQDTTPIIVTMQHFYQALEEVEPSFGIAEDELKTMLRGELIEWGADYMRLLDTGRVLVKQVQNSEQTPLMSLLLEGESGSGMTAIAAKLAIESGFPYMKVINPESYLGFNESSKCSSIAKIFEDAYKSPLSLIIIDNIERLLEYVPIGPRFSNQVLQTLLVVLKRIPPVEGRKLMVIATTSSLSILRDMEMKQAFKHVHRVSQLTKAPHVLKVMEQMGIAVEKEEANNIANACAFPIGIKQLIDVMEMAKQTGQNMTKTRFMECLRSCGFDQKLRFEEEKE